MRMSQLQHLTLFSFAALHLLLFSICPVSSSRIYRTKDAVVIEGSTNSFSNLIFANFRMKLFSVIFLRNIDILLLNPTAVESLYFFV